jgi:hypothetical protein
VAKRSGKRARESETECRAAVAYAATGRVAKGILEKRIETSFSVHASPELV